MYRPDYYPPGNAVASGSSVSRNLYYGNGSGSTSPPPPRRQNQFAPQPPLSSTPAHKPPPQNQFAPVAPSTPAPRQDNELQTIPSVTQTPRERFFPLPFRIDDPAEDEGEEEYDTAEEDGGEFEAERVSPSEALTSQKGDNANGHRAETSGKQANREDRMTRIKPPLRKRRKLLFTSQLPAPTETNPDGTPSVSSMRYESTLRLKSNWDSIYERFKDAHLLDQDDEIDLGQGKQEPRVIRDKGVLRALRGEMTFGSFHIKDADLDEVRKRLKTAGGDDFEDDQEATANKAAGGNDPIVVGDSDEDESAPIDPEFVRSQYQEFRQHPVEKPIKREYPLEDDYFSDHSGIEEIDDPALLNDPELREFLQAEARRKAMCGDEGFTEDEDEDEVVDLMTLVLNNQRRRKGLSGDDNSSKNSSDEEGGWRDIKAKGGPSRRPQADAKRPSHKKRRLFYQDDRKNKGDEYDTMVEVKRARVDVALGSKATFEGCLPFDDIPGLAQLLGLPQAPRVSIDHNTRTIDSNKSPVISNGASLVVSHAEPSVSSNAKALAIDPMLYSSSVFKSVPATRTLSLTEPSHRAEQGRLSAPLARSSSETLDSAARSRSVPSTGNETKKPAKPTHLEEVADIEMRRTSGTDSDAPPQVTQRP